MKTRFSLLFVFLFSLVASVQAIPIQDPEEQSPQEEAKALPADSVKTVSLSMTQITKAFSASSTLMNEAKKILFTEELIASYVRDVDTLYSEIDLLLADTSKRKLEDMDVTELDLVKKHADLLMEEIEKVQAKLSKNAVEQETYTNLLQEDRENWEITLANLPLEEVPEERVKRIHRTISDLDSIRGLLISDMGQILNQEDRLAERFMQVEQYKSLMITREDFLGSHLFSREQPGLFRCGGNKGNSSLLRKHLVQIRSSFQEDMEIMKDRFRLQMIGVFVFFILLLSYTFWYKEHFKRTYSSRKFKVSKTQEALIQSPLVVSIFITGALIRFIYQDLPHTFHSLNFVIFMIPMAVIVVRIFGMELKPWFLLLGSLYILTFFYELTYDPDILLRLAMLLFTLSALGLFLWLYIKQPDSFHFRAIVIRRLLRLLLFILIVLLFIALGANLLGAFSLAEFFTLLPIQIVLLAVGVQIATKIVDTVIYMFLISRYMQKVNVVRDDYEFIYRKIVGLLDLLLWIFFFHMTLSVFRIREQFYGWGKEFMTNAIKVGEAEISLWSVTLFILVIWISVVVTRVVRHILEKDVFSRVQTAKGIPSTVSLMARVILLTAGFFLAAAAAGIKLSNLSIILGAFSVGIGFGLQNIFNNMVSGIILALERPIKVGDIVQVGELLGIVKIIGLRSSTVKSFDGAEVIVPNGNLISQEMINWTLSDSNRRIDIRVGVAYGTKPGKVVELMQEVADAHDRVDKKPPPTAYFIEFGDSSLNFRLLAWTHMDHRLEVESELNMGIEEALQKAGIEVPFPQVDLNIKKDLTKGSAASMSKA